MSRNRPGLRARSMRCRRRAQPPARCCGAARAGALSVSALGLPRRLRRRRAGGGGEGRGRRRSRRARSPSTLTSRTGRSTSTSTTSGTRRSTSSRRSTARRSSTSRRSTTTTSSSARSASSTPQGNSGGRDLHVVTDWMASRMKRLGYVQKFDKSAMPNAVKNIERRGCKPRLRPQARVLDAVAVGPGDLIYRKDMVGGDLTSVNDLFDPKFKGKVTLLTEMRDTVGLGAAGDGIEPEKATLDQVMAAIDKLEKGVEGRPDPRASPATSTPRTSPRATRARSSAGRATRCSSRPTTRTSSSCSRRRAS